MAQAIEKSTQGYISLDNDIKLYQITCVPDSKDYVAYGQAIREKIRQNLKSKYKDFFQEGDVCLSFVLNSDGSLCSFGVNTGSSANEKLRDIATISLRKAAPFPPFPSSLPYDRITFRITVSFQKNDQSFS